MSNVIDLAAWRAQRAAATPAAAPVAPAAYVPAYCDPANERRGARYDRALSTKEIAARIRAEVKAAIKRGAIPREVKVSVRFRSFAGGSAIDIRVTRVPPGFAILNAEHVRAALADPHNWEATRGLPRYAPDAVALLAQLTAMARAYHRDNSDSAVDYFDVNFYGGDAAFDWRLERDARRALEAKIASLEPQS